MDAQTAMLLAALFCFVVGGILIVSRQMKAKKCTATTSGVVSAIISQVNTHTEHEEREEGVIRFGGDRTRTTTYTTYHPEFTYTVNGAEYVHASKGGSTHCRLKKGQAVTVRYDPADPNVCVVKEDRSGSVLAWGFLIFGIALVGFWFYISFIQ